MVKKKRKPSMCWLQRRVRTVTIAISCRLRDAHHVQRRASRPQPRSTSLTEKMRCRAGQLRLPGALNPGLSHSKTRGVPTTSSPSGLGTHRFIFCLSVFDLPVFSTSSASLPLAGSACYWPPMAIAARTMPGQRCPRPEEGGDS